MQIIFNILLGLVIMAVGFLLIIKTEWFLENFGRMDFFEAKLATSGGSRLGYKIVGLIFIFIGFLLATGLISGFLGWILSPLINLSKPNASLNN